MIKATSFIQPTSGAQHNDIDGLCVHRAASLYYATTFSIASGEIVSLS